jgi:hypothetical protein
MGALIQLLFILGLISCAICEMHIFVQIANEIRENDKETAEENAGI